MLFPWRQYADSTLFRHKTALRDGQGASFNWAQLADVIDCYACALWRQGVTPGCGIALWAKNDLHILLLYLAAIQSGARVLGINPAFPEQKALTLCQDNQIQFYYSPSAETLPNLTALYLPAGQDDHRTAVAPVADFQRPATMTLTSGSSGMPKAVVHNVQAHLDNARGVCELMAFDTHSSWLLSLPLYHVSGQGIVWRWLHAGARLHLSGDDFYADVLRASHVSLVPTQLQRLLGYLAQHDERSFSTHHILLGGSQIPMELTRRAQALGIRTYSGYGMTEMASTVFAKPSDASDGVGQPLPGREYCLVNDEIWLRGAGLALGYWRQGDIVPLVNSQGWLQTKDKGLWQNNELVVSGRLDNMFVSGGENIQPEEIERVILTHDEVEQVFILPLDDAEFGQRPLAMIKFKDNFSQSAVENLTLWLADKLEKFKQPVRYLPLESEPWQQGNIKISRAQLKVRLAQLLGK
ncbi:o-succinylbenzoate--CoA ligase [Necropsobacter massiliensis]|uniref:o-succinylbenzoate--CoA ligase n=1 Tax=Necropsobacter massiliensis TaxID=1400001 RepID=UPI000595B81E|nr:o-succinylbenzoate--CoA ligase [Necropsobacter massiliensis]